MHRTDKVESTLRELNLRADDKYATTVNTHVIFTDRCNKTHKSCAQETTHAVRRQRNALFPVLPNDMLRVSQDAKILPGVEHNTTDAFTQHTQRLLRRVSKLSLFRLAITLTYTNPV